MKTTLAVLLAFAPALAGAATFTVTNTSDSDAGSLRLALVSANASVGTHTVAFAIPGAGPHTITLASALPTITRAVTIDGFSQPGSQPNTRMPAQGGLDAQPMIELSGGGTLATLLTISHSAVDPAVIRGLVLNRASVGIVSTNLGPVRIEGCFIGTDVTGTSVPMPMQAGLQVLGNVTIGGTAPSARNLIAGATQTNASVGIQATLGPTGPTIVGNLIGTDISGMLALPNQSGVLFSRGNTMTGSPGPRVGGPLMTDRNVISGNLRRGIALNCSFTNYCFESLRIAGNYIGTDATGNGPLPNAEGGIGLYNASGQVIHVLVGGPTPAWDNRIAWNGGPGVYGGYAALDVSGNRIEGNVGEGIDIGSAGRTPNDPGDADGGWNRSQNFPEILSASIGTDALRVSYRIDTAPANATWPLRVQFFSAATRGGEALPASLANPLVAFSVDSYPESLAQQQRDIVIPLPAGLPAFRHLVAVATDAAGYSSEFSEAYELYLFRDGFDGD